MHGIERNSRSICDRSALLFWDNLSLLDGAKIFEVNNFKGGFFPCRLLGILCPDTQTLTDGFQISSHFRFPSLMLNNLGGYSASLYSGCFSV